MRHPLIIVEGPDCVGKTTLAKYICKTLPAIYVKCPSAMKGPEAPRHFDCVLDTAKFNIANGHTVVVDRLWPSEVIYSTACGRDQWGEALVKHFDDRVGLLNGLYVLCERSDVIEAHAKERDEDHPYGPQTFLKILEGYATLAKQWHDRDDVIIYNFDIMASQLHKMLDMIRDL